MTRLFVLCLAIVLCSVDVGAVNPKCSSVNGIVTEIAMGKYASCLSIFTQTATASGDENQCRLLLSGITCIASQLDSANTQECARALFGDLQKNQATIITVLQTAFNVVLPTDIGVCTQYLAGGAITTTSPPPTACMDFTAMSSRISDFSQCKNEFEEIMRPTDDRTKCKAVHMALECVANVLAPADHGSCVTGLKQYLKTSPLVMIGIMTLLGVDNATSFAFDLSKCASAVGPPHPDCLNVTAILPRISNFTDCKAEFRPLLGSGDEEDKCEAVHDGIACLAKHLVDDDHDRCVTMFKRAVYNSTMLLRTILQELGFDVSTFQFNVTVCTKYNDDDDDDDEAEKVCRNTTAVTNQISMNLNCTRPFANVSGTNNKTTQCMALGSGLLCIANRLVGRTGVEMCVGTIMRTMYNNSVVMNAIRAAVRNAGHSVPWLATLDPKTCFEEKDDKCSDVKHAISVAVLHDECITKFIGVVTETDVQKQCDALFDGLKCLASKMKDTEKEASSCFARMKETLQASPGDLIAAMQQFGSILPPGFIAPDVTQCKGCPAGIPTVRCAADPCQGRTCKQNPNAKCKANYCGGCNFDFFVEGQEFPVECDCADEDRVQCFADPCTVTTCPVYPDAKCSASYCGGCNAYFYVNGVDVTSRCNDCPVGIPTAACVADPCQGKSCKHYPSAKCRANYCGGCNYDFYIDGQEFPVECDCKEGVYQCLKNPCDDAKCPAYKNAKCRDNYCGGCNAYFYLNGVDVTRRCHGADCPSGVTKKCNTTACSPSSTCRYLKEAECKIDPCTCQEMFTYYDKRVNCSKYHTDCQKKQMRVEKEEKEKNDNANGSNEKSKRIVCTAKGRYEKECEENTCTCLDAKNGTQSGNRQGGENLDCSDVQRQTGGKATTKVKAKIVVAKNMQVSDLPESAREKTKTQMRLATKVLAPHLTIEDDMLVDGSILYVFNATAASDSDVDTETIVNGLNDDIDAGLFPEIAVDGHTFVVSDGSVVETFEEEPQVIPKDDDDDDDGDNKTIIIVVVVVVAVVLLAAIVTGVYCYRKSESSGDKSQFSDLQGQSNMAYKLQP